MTYRQSLRHLIAIGLLPSAYMFLGIVAGLFGQQFADDVRWVIANCVMGLILSGISKLHSGQAFTLNRILPVAR